MKYFLILPRLLLLGLLMGTCGLNAVAGKLEAIALNAKPSESSSHAKNPIQELIVQGETFRAQGHLREAGDRFQQALELARQSDDAKYKSLATGLYGYNLFLQQDYAQAKTLMQSALTQARAARSPILAAIHGNHLGNYYSARRQFSLAGISYRDALSSAQHGADTGLIVRIQINQIRMDALSDPEGAWERLQRIEKQIGKVEPFSARTPLLLAAGYQAAKIIDYQAGTANERIQFASALLREGLSLARKTGDVRSQSMALGYLGMIEEGRGLNAQALKLTGEAVRVLQAFGDDDLLLQWEWQRGRLLKAFGDKSAALKAYRRAVSHIEAIRGDIPVDYQDGRSSFRETLQPVYLGLADLLIQESETAEPGEELQNLLKNARSTVELIKKTEIEDYFNNRCNIQTLPEIEIETIAPRTAALYPIVLDDRLELLVSLPDGIFHKSVAIPGATLEKSARLLATRLRNYENNFKRPATDLYNWLIAPISELLKSQDIDTLVFVPDGALRLVPLAALFDGNQYVIETYAVATSPGLTLFDPKPLSRQNTNMLIAGLSVPGPVIKTLPNSYLQLLLNAVGENSEAPNRSIPKTRDIASKLSGSESADVPNQALGDSKIRNLLDQPAIYASVKDLLSLPGVTTEVENLSTLFPATTLINETFQLPRVQQEINQSPYNLVHIASHGVFGKSSEESFIMAHDQIISIDQLEALLSSANLKDNPIELLALSACQTAEGDDRSPLGISGIAIRAKVRSVLGSLWSVDDDATLTFMQGFYQQLQDPDISKARAMQLAQQQLLKNDRFQHPFFWSPFLLIGNWL